MALIKYGGGIVQMSGSIAGTVFARNKSGNYARPRTKPVNPKSPRQEAARTAVSFLAEHWHANLTAVVRDLWEVYAAAVPMKNKLGETIHLSGFNHYIRSNAPTWLMGRGLFETAPTILSLPEKDPDTAITEEDIAGQTFTIVCDDASWFGNGESNWGQPVYMGKPQLVSRQTYHGPFRYCDYINVAEGAAGTATIAAAYAFAEGQKVWFRSRILTKSGRFSEPWQLDPRTIVADP